ncbi:MAG: adenylate cyclase [Acidimicrobiaceae bacterium]
MARSATLVGVPVGLWIAVYYGLWGPTPAGDSRLQDVASNVVLFVVFLVGFAALYRPLNRLLDKELGWMVSGSEPSADEVEALVGLPTRLAMSLFKAMVLVAVITSALNLVSQREPAEAVRVAIGLGLTALVVAALAYLVAERELRPAFAAGLRELRGRRLAVGVRRRLELAWLVGSGVPLLFILAVPLGNGEGEELPGEVPAMVMAGLGLFLGVIATSVVARSVADPLDRLRAAVERVEADDLDVTVDVDDPGEIGRLQAAFDRMVVGLRERRQLEDLFGRHVGIDVARQALESGIRLGGERREVTVYFVDIRGSTQMTESVPPEVVVDKLNAVFAAVADAADSEGGWINKFEGDAALVVFGAPTAEPDHAGRALRSARRLRDSLRDDAATADITVGIGVASGTAVAGNIGSEDRYEYTVIGRPVNEAARLTELAKDSPEHLLASGATVAGAPQEADFWHSTTATVLRGLTDPTHIYAPS